MLTILVPGADEEVVGNRNGTVRGAAYDTRTRAELGVGVDRVQVYLDAERDRPASQFIGEVRPHAPRRGRSPLGADALETRSGTT